MTDLELSFQFPINRVGASPVVAAGAADSVASGSADSIASGSAVSVTAGTGAGASSPSLSELDITIAPSKRIPRSTTKRTFADEPWLFVAGFEVALVDAALGFVAAAPRVEVGVVETFTRDEPFKGTGGITICEELFFFAAVFLVVFFLATDFFAAVFFTTFLTVFLAADFFATFLAGDFFAVFLAVDFFGAAFLAADFFFTATFISLS
jgi:hypothetical protein